jgi:hypothetical protein
VKRGGTVTANARKLYEIAREVTADEVAEGERVGWLEPTPGNRRRA